MATKTMVMEGPTATTTATVVGASALAMVRAMVTATVMAAMVGVTAMAMEGATAMQR